MSVSQTALGDVTPTFESIWMWRFKCAHSSYSSYKNWA